MHFVKEKENNFVLMLVISKWERRDKLIWVQKILEGLREKIETLEANFLCGQN